MYDRKNFSRFFQKSFLAMLAKTFSRPKRHIEENALKIISLCKLAQNVVAVFSVFRIVRTNQAVSCVCARQLRAGCYARKVFDSPIFVVCVCVVIVNLRKIQNNIYVVFVALVNHFSHIVEIPVFECFVHFAVFTRPVV